MSPTLTSNKFVFTLCTQEWMNYVVPSLSAQRQSADVSGGQPIGNHLSQPFWSFEIQRAQTTVHFCNKKSMTLLKARHSRDALPCGLRVVTPWYSSNFLVQFLHLPRHQKSCFYTSELSKGIGKDCIAPELATLCQTHKCCAETAAAQRSQGQLQNRKNHLELQRITKKHKLMDHGTTRKQEKHKTIRNHNKEDIRY